jgi:hypothetical protein
MYQEADFMRIFFKIFMPVSILAAVFLFMGMDSIA